MTTLINKGQHPIFGSSKPSIHVQKFFPRPGKKRNRLNEKIDVDPNEKVDHDVVSINIINVKSISAFNKLDSKRYYR